MESTHSNALGFGMCFCHPLCFGARGPPNGGQGQDLVTSDAPQTEGISYIICGVLPSRTTPYTGLSEYKLCPINQQPCYDLQSTFLLTQHPGGG